MKAPFAWQPPVPRVREQALAHSHVRRLRDGDPDGLMAANPDAYYFFEERTGTPMFIVSLSCWMLCVMHLVQAMPTTHLSGLATAGWPLGVFWWFSLPGMGIPTADPSSVWRTDAF